VDKTQLIKALILTKQIVYWYNLRW
jgi:hypothetical protein